MTPSPIDILSDSGTHDSVDDDADDSSESLEHQAHEPASEAFVRRQDRRMFRLHVRTCPMRRLRVWLVFAAGVLFAGQIAVVVIIRLGIIAAQAELNKTIKSTVEEVLKEKKIIGTEESPHPIFATTTAKGGQP